MIFPLTIIYQVQTTMETTQFISWMVAVIAGIVTAILAIKNFRKSIDERQADLMWKKANTAKEFVKEIHEHKSSAAAIAMLDWFIIGHYQGFEIPGKKEINYEEVLNAIKKISDRSFNEREHYILDCFDWFFYYIGLTEQYIRDGLFNFDHVKYVFYPYYKKILENRNLYVKFLTERHYILALDFLNRFKNDKELKTTNLN